MHKKVNKYNNNIFFHSMHTHLYVCMYIRLYCDNKSIKLYNYKIIFIIVYTCNNF